MDQLTSETPALWGNLKAQSMVEHLVEAVEYTNGKRPAALHVSQEEADRKKNLLVHSDFVITKGARGYLTDATKTKRYGDLRTAIDELRKSTRLNISLDQIEKLF